MVTIRMSEAQAKLLFAGEQQKASGPRAPRVQKRRENLPENQVEGQINGFLAVRGWTSIRQQVGLWVPWHQVAGKETVKVSTLRPHRFGKKGMSDWMAVRVAKPDVPAQPAPRLGANAQFFYYEVKGSGKTPDEKQRFWLDAHAACGFLAAWFDDYDGDWPTSFVPWYRARFGD